MIPGGGHVRLTACAVIKRYGDAAGFIHLHVVFSCRAAAAQSWVVATMGKFANLQIRALEKQFNSLVQESGGEPCISTWPKLPHSRSLPGSRGAGLVGTV